MRSTPAQNAAYIRGLCVGLCGRPYSAGRTRCEECHTARYDDTTTGLEGVSKGVA